jgi:hypothetical protein
MFWLHEYVLGTVSQEQVWFNCSMFIVRNISDSCSFSFLQLRFDLRFFCNLSLRIVQPVHGISGYEVRWGWGEQRSDMLWIWAIFKSPPFSGCSDCPWSSRDNAWSTRLRTILPQSHSFVWSQQSFTLMSRLVCVQRKRESVIRTDVEASGHHLLSSSDSIVTNSSALRKEYRTRLFLPARHACVRCCVIWPPDRNAHPA